MAAQCITQEDFKIWPETEEENSDKICLAGPLIIQYITMSVMFTAVVIIASLLYYSTVKLYF